MMTRKAAVEIASNHLAELIPTQSAPLLEEYFFADGTWQITLSYHAAPIPNGQAVHAANGTGAAKEYKSFAVDGRSGEVLSMKIRTLKP